MEKNKINRVIKVLLFSYIIILPLLDICKYYYSNIEIFGFSLIEFTNIFFCVTMMFMILWNKYRTEKKIDKSVIISSLIFFVYIIFHSLNVIKISNDSEVTMNIAVEIYYIIRAYILPFVLLYVINNVDINKNKIFNLLSFLGFIIAFVILISNIFNFGIITYDSYFGNDSVIYGNIFNWYNDITIHNYVHYMSKGIFVSGNQLSLIMVSLLTISSLCLIREKKWYLYISYIIKCISLIIISTKTSTFGLFIVLLFTFFALIFSKIIDKKEKILTNTIYILIVIFLSLQLFMISPLSYKLGIKTYDTARSEKANTGDTNQENKGENDGNKNPANDNNETNDNKTIDNTSSNTEENLVCGFQKQNEAFEVTSEVTSLNMRKYIYNTLYNTSTKTNKFCSFLEKNELATFLKKQKYTPEEEKEIIEIIENYSSFFGIHSSLIKFMPPEDNLNFWIEVINNKSEIKSDFRIIKRLMAEEFNDKNFNNYMGKLFGITYISGFPNVENDVIAQYTWFGFLGVNLFVLVFYFLFVYYTIYFVLNLNKKNLIEEIFIMFSIFVILSICILSGHWFGDMFSMAILIMLFGLCHAIKKENLNKNEHNKKKLLFVIWSFTMGGGAEKVLANLVNNLSPDKYDISVIEYWHTDVRVEKVNSNIKVLKPVVDSLKEPLLLRKFKELCLKYCSDILRLFYANDDYDVEIAFNCLFPTFFVRSNVNALAVFHGDIYNFRKEKYKYFMQKLNLNKFKKIITISENSYNSIVDVYPKIKNDVVLIKNGLIEKEILNLSKENINYMEENYYLYIGRLDSNKNPLFLLDLADIIKKANNGYKIKIMGTGELFTQLKNEINKRNLNDIVELMGYIKNPYPYIKKSKALLLCSYSEGLPTVLLEGIFLDKPFISTLVGGVKELAVENSCGIIASNPEEFYNAIMKFEKNTKIYNHYVENCKITKKQYTIEVQVKKFEDLIDNMEV